MNHVRIDTTAKGLGIDNSQATTTFNRHAIGGNIPVTTRGDRNSSDRSRPILPVLLCWSSYRLPRLHLHACCRSVFHPSRNRNGRIAIIDKQQVSACL